MGKLNCGNDDNKALEHVRSGLGGEQALSGRTVSRGVITMVAYVKEVGKGRVPLALQWEGATYVIELVHVRPVWPPLPVPGLSCYQGHLGLTPDIQTEIRKRLLGP